MTRISIIDSVLCTRHSSKHYTLINLSNLPTKHMEKEVLSFLFLTMILSGLAYLTGFSNSSAVQNLPAMQETWVWCLGQEDPLE